MQGRRKGGTFGQNVRGPLAKGGPKGPPSAKGLGPKNWDLEGPEGPPSPPALGPSAEGGPKGPPSAKGLGAEKLGSSGAQRAPSAKGLRAQKWGSGGQSTNLSDASSEISDIVDRNHKYRGFLHSIDCHLWPGQLGDELPIPSLFVLIAMGTVGTN